MSKHFWKLTNICKQIYLNKIIKILLKLLKNKINAECSIWEILAHAEVLDIVGLGIKKLN